MKKIFLLISSGMLGVLFAQQTYLNQNIQGTSFRLANDNPEIIELEFNAGDITLREVLTPAGVQSVVEMNNGTPILEAGSPDLPSYNTSVIVPDDARMKVEVTDAQYIEYTGISMAPSKGHILRTVNPADVDFTYSPVYTQDAFWPAQTATLSSPYIMRDFRAQTVTVNPVQYNSVTHTLRVYTRMTVTVSVVDNNGENVLVRTAPADRIDAEFDGVYKASFANYGNISRYATIAESGSMLIIADPAFESAMTPFVNWKIQRGMKTVMVNTTATGTTPAAIKAYIQNYFTANSDLKYVLLVGDHEQIPAQMPDGSNGLAGPSDNFYAYLVGNDRYPDIVVGRFSAATVADVSTQVTRSIQYEKAPLLSATYGKSTHIGSDQGPGDDNEMDFEHQRNIRGKLLGFTYTAGDELYDGSQGGMDAAGNPDPMDVVDVLNDGRGILTYTGHGWDDGFGTSSFSSSQVPSLTNTTTLPFIWSVACVNGNFTGYTCFAEVLTRSRNASGDPTGAVAALMSTINQYWNEPMEGQDAMVDLLAGTFGDTKRTFGSLSMNGCMQMNDSYGTYGMDMTDTWTCFGDPSLLVRTATPQVLTAFYNGSILPGTTNVDVTCAVEGALVAITMNNTILGTAYVNGGVAHVTIPATAEGDELTVTVTAFNYVPSIGNVDVTAAALGVNNEAKNAYIYPNPASDFIGVQVQNTTVLGVEVNDLTGKTMFTYNNAFSSAYMIPVAGWAKGVYTVKLKTENQTRVYKVVIH